MICYEVTLKIEREIFAAYKDWLAQHIGEMLKFDGFESAKVYEVEVEDSKSSHVSLVVAYNIRNREDLESYFKGPAAEMRQDGVSRFGNKFSASRRILTEIRL